VLAVWWIVCLWRWSGNFQRWLSLLDQPGETRPGNHHLRSPETTCFGVVGPKQDGQTRRRHPPEFAGDRADRGSSRSGSACVPVPGPVDPRPAAAAQPGGSDRPAGGGVGQLSILVPSPLGSSPCPPSRLGLRRHARGPQPVPAPGIVSISPDPPDHPCTASPTRLRCLCAQGTPHQLRPARPSGGDHGLEAREPSNDPPGFARAKREGLNPGL
jgi:hypothetical protein